MMPVVALWNQPEHLNCVFLMWTVVKSCALRLTWKLVTSKNLFLSLVSPTETLWCHSHPNCLRFPGVIDTRASQIIGLLLTPEHLRILGCYWSLIHEYLLLHKLSCCSHSIPQLSVNILKNEYWNVEYCRAFIHAFIKVAALTLTSKITR